MMRQYILYAQTIPFLGYIVGYGWVDIEQKPDGSTVAEYLQRRMKGNPDLALYVGSQKVLDKQRQKFDPATRAVVDKSVVDVIPPPKEVAIELEKQASISDLLPSWSEVEAEINSITTIAAAKVFLKKLSRIVYWLAKNKVD